MGLLHFNKPTYDSLPDALYAIEQELKSLCPIDTKDIKWTRDASGARAVIKRMTGGGGVSTEPDADDTPVNIRMCKIVSVPSAGYGYGTAKTITGYNVDGTPILSEEEIPVFIPRL